jgi:AraC-like DNA-binding protein
MARIALPIVAQLEKAGANVGAVLAAAGLERGQLEDPDARIDHERWVALLEIGAEATHDPDFGLHAAERLSPRSYPLPALLILSLPTVGEGLDRLSRYFRIVHEGMAVRVLLDGVQARCRLEFSPGLAHPGVLAEHMLAYGSVLGQQFLGQEAPGPLEARFAHAPPASTAEHQRVIRAPVVFGTEHTEMVFSSAMLAVPLGSANTHLSSLLEGEARRLADRLPRDGTVAGQCATWIRAELPTGREPRLDTIADALRMGARTLRRRLEEEGTTLRAVVDDVRREIAEERVRSGELSLDEIALLLGFSEAAAFRRAFKRWTGRTPSQYRRARSS